MNHAGRACLFLMLATTPAAAQLTAFWQRVPITPQAIAGDPVLANMQCWDLMVTPDGSWSAAYLREQLASGQFYNHPLGGNTRPNTAIIGVFPALGFDTYITSPSEPGGAAPNIFGGFPEGQPFSMSGSTLSVGWGELARYAPGTYQIARVTFPADTFPDVLNNNPVPVPVWSHATQILPDAMAEIPEIPEPALGAAFAIVLAACAASRRRG